MKIFIVIVICLTLLYSCKRENNSINYCSYGAQAQIRNIYVPDSAKVDSTIPIDFIWENYISCQTFDTFGVNIQVNFRELTFNTKIDTCNCDNSQLGTVYKRYTFISHTLGLQIVKYGLSQDTITIY